jgi:excinuclease UvrABC nuclease subunit
MNIHFSDGQLAHPFSDPSKCFPISELPGLYAVMIYDASCQPRPYRVLYFGKAANLRQRVCASHEKFWAWQMEAGLNSPLFFSYLRVNAEADRARIERDLIANYSPVCNEKGNPMIKALYGI